MGLNTRFCLIIIFKINLFFSIFVSWCVDHDLFCFLFFSTYRGADAWWKIPLFFYPSLSASLIFRFQVMWFVQFACVFLLLIFLCNLPFCLLPLHFSLLVDFAQKVDLALLVHFFSVVEQTYIIYLSWSEFCMIWVIWKLPVGFSTVPSWCFLGDGTVPSRCFLRDGTVPSRCILRDGTVPSYNHYLNLMGFVMNKIQLVAFLLDFQICCNIW